MKSYFAKIYQPNGKYIDTLKDISFSGFSKKINGGLGELSFIIPRQFDDFDEDYIIKLNNRIDLWINDNDTGTDGKKIYSGFISKYEPSIIGTKENIRVVCLGYISKLAMSILKYDTYIELTTDTTNILTQGHNASPANDVSDVVKAIIDRYQAEAVNPQINYSTNSIENTGEEMLYIFNTKFYNDAIEKCRESSPTNWWWYIGADNILQFKPKPTRATHTFVFGKHFKDIKVEKNMENVINNILFCSNNQNRQIVKRYQDITSEDQFDDRWYIYTDSRVTQGTTADRMSNSELDAKKDAQVKVIIEIADNNGTNSGYDIESIEPGDTCRFTGFNDITSRTFTDNMQILSVDYTPDSVKLEIESLNPSIARENQENKRKIAEQEAIGRSASYDTDETNKIAQGWNILTKEGIRISNTSFTIEGNYTDLLTIGYPLMFTDTTIKYANITSSSYSSITKLTTINIIGGTTYILVGNPTDIFFAYGNAVGFPPKFAYTFQFYKNDGTSTLTSTQTGGFIQINNRTLFGGVEVAALGDPSGGNYYLAAPITPNVSGKVGVGGGIFADSSTSRGCFIYWNNSVNKMGIQRPEGGNWYTSGAGAGFINFNYPI